MKIELRQRTAETVLKYFQMAQDPEIKRFLPQKAATLEEALADYQKTLLPGSTSYGRTIWLDGVYAGDIWCYCLQAEEPNAMVSYCVFEKEFWGRGAASGALSLFLTEIAARFQVKTLGAFTYSANAASIRVLLKNGFQEMETFLEDGVESKYFQMEMNGLYSLEQSDIIDRKI